MLGRLLDVLFPPRSDEAIVGELGRDEFLSLLAPTPLRETKPETVGLLPFGDPRVRAVIHEAKYHGSESAFALLGAVFGEYLRDADERTTRMILVPVPLGTFRRRERGYNQVESVVAAVAHDLNIALEVALLQRTRETVSQISLPRTARIENMRGAFAVSPGQKVSPTALYVLIDDVITTGATMQAAIEALQAGGARHILPIALAH